MARNVTPHKKRVLVVCQHFWPENFRINDICGYLIEQGCDIEVLCGLPNYPSGRFPEGYGFFKNRKQIHDGITIHRALEIPRGNNTNVRIFLNYISFPLASLFHIPRLLTKKYDRIYIYQLSPVLMSLAGIIVGKIKRTEITMHVLDLWPENLYSVLPIHNHLLRRLAEGVSHWHYKKADKLIALSEKMKHRLVEATGKPKGKIIVLPQACEKIYETAAHDNNLAKRFPRGFNVVFTGSITPAQSFPTIIEAAKLLKTNGLEINWVIVGDGMARKEIENEIAKKDLADSFSFEGQRPIEDIPKYADIADVLVGCLVKSDLLEATIPAKVLSYIALGKPIVLAMDGEVQNLINNTIRCGYVGPTEDPTELAKNIEKIYASPKVKRDDMGKRARNYHFKHFERNLVLHKLYEFMFQ